MHDASPHYLLLSTLHLAILHLLTPPAYPPLPRYRHRLTPRFTRWPRCPRPPIPHHPLDRRLTPRLHDTRHHADSRLTPTHDAPAPILPPRSCPPDRRSDHADHSRRRCRRRLPPASHDAPAGRYPRHVLGRDDVPPADRRASADRPGRQPHPRPAATRAKVSQ